MGNSLFTGGSIHISLNQNEDHIDTYHVGQTISGTVYVDQHQPFDAKALTIFLVGQEIVHFH